MTNPGGTVATEAGHWYLPPDGVPFYTIIGKDGAERNVTLRDARKVGAVPSVTTIIKCAASPALEKWKRDNPDWQEVSEKARDAGTAIHGNIERWLCAGPCDTEYWAHVKAAGAALKDWSGPLDEIRPERSFYHPLGYGGKCDVHKKPSIDLNDTHNGFVADFKTKDFTADKLPDVYDNHFMQLAAYREGFDMPLSRCAIIYVSTSVPGLTHLVEVDEVSLARGWNMFKALLTYWQHQKRYAPQNLAA
jgi:hypothetical protein